MARSTRLRQPWADLHAAYSLLHGLRGKLAADPAFHAVARAGLLALADEELRLREGRRLLGLGRKEKP